MDQVSDITYRADSKRLGDESLHNDFGEFRHYIVEKYAYNMVNRFTGIEASDVSFVESCAAFVIFSHRRCCSGLRACFPLG